MTYLVFSQAADLSVPAERLAAQARAHFGASLAPEGTLFSYTSHGAAGVFAVEARPVKTEDVDDARAAERNGTGAGLADLAARCSTVWTIAEEHEGPEWLVVEFCAVLASVALGPILTPHRDHLFGVRSARERANERRGAPNLMR